jgi:hypothetical protein
VVDQNQGVDMNNSFKRYDNPGKALEQLQSDYNRWSSLLTENSIKISYALIGANWAVHGSTGQLLINQYAKFSMITILIFLGINLISTNYITRLI